MSRPTPITQHPRFRRPQTKTDRARTRRLQREIDRMMALPDMEPALKALTGRLEGDPALQADLGRRIAKALRLGETRADAGRVGGLVANRKLTRAQLSERGRPGGRAAFGLPDEQQATATGKELQARRAMR